MPNLNDISERLLADLEARNQARDAALSQARVLTRNAAHAIRAIHRLEPEVADALLAEARAIVENLKRDLKPYPELFHSGYVQDAIKEFAEASITCALVMDKELPAPDALGVETAAYLNGLAETIGELRRRCMDVLRQGYSPEAERLLDWMDEIYLLLVSVDYPDAITNGLRRQTDVARSLVERTRSDLTLSLRDEQVIQALNRMHDRLDNGEDALARDPGL
jgi:translin